MKDPEPKPGDGPDYHADHAAWRRRNPDPAHIQRNVESLAAIGGLYDAIAAQVEQDHADLLARHRLDTGAKSLVELFQERGHRPTPNANETGDTECPK